MAARITYTGKLNLDIDVRLLRAAENNLPSEDSFYSRLENLEGRWTIARIDNQIEATALYKALSSKADGSSFSSRVKTIAEASRPDGDENLSFWLPLSLMKPEGRVQFRVDDALFDLEIDYDPKGFENYKKMVALIFNKFAWGQRPKTPITVNFDAGNCKLFIRGTGPNMSWDKGIELSQVDGKHIYEMPADCGEFEFKFLRDDKHWEQGPNHIAKGGQAQTINPLF